MIKASNISVSYKNGNTIQHILKNESFIINDGEFVMITGPSGSGKTTLLKVLSGIQKPNEGSIYWDKVDLYSEKPNKISKLRLEQSGFVYQDFMLIDELNVYDNIILPKRLLKDKNDVNVLRIINDLKLNNLLKKYPAVLSGGEKQRVAIARSLVNKPKILFCDEPTGSLDYKTTKEIMDLLDHINKEYHITIVMVTHELENLAYATRIIKYSNGTLICD